MKIALSSDYVSSMGCAEPYLRGMSEAGFTHVHWCHQWCTDFLYSDSEIREIGKWLKRYGLTLLDIHGSMGQEKCWFSTEEYQREAGVELVANRMRMLRALEGTGTVMMHIPCVKFSTTPVELPALERKVSALRKSLDALLPLSLELKVPIAVENLPGDSFKVIGELLRDYPAEFLGLCYDSGHGHIFDDRGLDHLDRFKDRLQALHIHDNDGTGDQHQPPFYGTLDWSRFASILKASSYPREISFELSSRNSPYKDNIREFLADAYERCSRFVRMTMDN